MLHIQARLASEAFAKQELLAAAPLAPATRLSLRNPNSVLMNSLNSATVILQTAFDAENAEKPQKTQSFPRKVRFTGRESANFPSATSRVESGFN